MSDNWNNHILCFISPNLVKSSYLSNNCFAFWNRKTLIFEQSKQGEGSRSECRWFTNLSSKQTHYKALVLILTLVTVVWNLLIKFVLKWATSVTFLALSFPLLCLNPWDVEAPPRPCRQSCSDSWGGCFKPAGADWEVHLCHADTAGSVSRATQWLSCRVTRLSQLGWTQTFQLHLLL